MLRCQSFKQSPPPRQHAIKQAAAIGLVASFPQRTPPSLLVSHWLTRCSSWDCRCLLLPAASPLLRLQTAHSQRSKCALAGKIASDACTTPYASRRCAAPRGKPFTCKGQSRHQLVVGRGWPREIWTISTTGGVLELRYTQSALISVKQLSMMRQEGQHCL